MPMRMGTKAHRALQLLLGLRHVGVANALAAYGFGDEDLQEGWDLLQRFGKMRLETAPPPVDAETLQALDRWENHWFPIADAALARGFPAAHATLFRNLAQTDGPEVILSVQTFVDRIDALQSGASACGAEGAKATKLLAKRGLNADVLREARDLLAALCKLAESEQPFSADPKVELAKAEEALWAWYLDWSKTARVAIKQRSLLRQLGFLQDRAGSGGETAEDASAPEGPQS